MVDRKMHLSYRLGSIMICFLIGALISLSVIDLSIGLTAGLVAIALGLALAMGVIAGLEPDIRSTEAFVWSWKAVSRHWLLLIALTLAGYVIGVLDVSSKYILISGIVGTLFGGLLGALFTVLVSGRLADVMPDTQYILVPNQEIRRSALHCLIIVLTCIPFEVAFIILGNEMGIVGIIGLGLLGSLSFGGLACIQHVILRFLL